MVFGIVVEAGRDAAVYSALIGKIRPDVKVLTRVCQDVVGVRRKFVGWLKHFQYLTSVGKALVIRDSDCRDSRAVEDELARILAQKDSPRKITLPVHFYATRCMLETLLLADESAVNAVATRRGKSPSATPVDDPLEGRRDSKDLFRRMLTQARLPADPAVYGEIASMADLDRIAQRCPYFAHFVDAVHHC